MPDATVTPAEHELQMLAPLVACAQALALRFGEAARAEPDPLKGLRLADAFHKLFQAFRFGIRLGAALRAPPRPVQGEAERADAERPEAEQPEVERLEAERPETEQAEPLEALEPLEREREREYEPVSLPKFLATLRGVAAEAAHPDMPADIRAGAATLRSLLARARPDSPAPVPAAPPSAAVALLTRPPPAAGRSALLGSAAPALRAPILPRPPPRRSG